VGHFVIFFVQNAGGGLPPFFGCAVFNAMRVYEHGIENKGERWGKKRNQNSGQNFFHYHFFMLPVI
jgi:hypothetical protein